ITTTSPKRSSKRPPRRCGRRSATIRATPTSPAPRDRSVAEATDTTPASDDAAMLKQYLGSRDVPCPHCNYNLRNLTSNVCPECGEEVTLRVQSLEPRQAAPIAGLVLLSAGAGLNGL